MASSSNRIPNLANPFNIMELFTPLKNYQYFEQYDQFPFNSQADKHDKHNAWWLAELSGLIYHEQAYVRQKLKQAFNVNDNAVIWLYGSERDTQGVMIELEDCYVIAFRGTEFYTPRLLSLSRLRSVRKDLITDLDFPKQQDALINHINMHNGFLNALKEIWPTIKQKIQANSKALWLTGHSMGGAISAAAALIDSSRVKGLYTYGMPCLGGDDIAEYCEEHLADKIFRYVNENDFIVNVMPQFLSGYSHCGEEKKLVLEKHNSPFEFIGDVFKLDMIDHSPLFYMLGTRQAI